MLIMSQFNLHRQNNWFDEKNVTFLAYLVRSASERLDNFDFSLNGLLEIVSDYWAYWIYRLHTEFDLGHAPHPEETLNSFDSRIVGSIVCYDDGGFASYREVNQGEICN